MIAKTRAQVAKVFKALSTPEDRSLMRKRGKAVQRALLEIRRRRRPKTKDMQRQMTI